MEFIFDTKPLIKTIIYLNNYSVDFNFANNLFVLLTTLKAVSISIDSQLCSQLCCRTTPRSFVELT